jgi:hypothetical protein
MGQKSVSVLLIVLSSIIACDANKHPDSNPTPNIQSIHSENEYGDTQVKQMLADRPNMRIYNPKKGVGYVTPEDEIWKWAARQFESEATGSKVYWNSELPKNRCGIATNNREKGFIRLPLEDGCGSGRGKKYGFQNLWRIAIFELCGVSQKKEFDEVLSKVKAGHLNKRQFIRAIGDVEYACMIKRCEVFEKVFKPWAQAHDLVIREEAWLCPLKHTSSEISDHDEKTIAPYWIYYSDLYDFSIAPGLKKKGIPIPK